MRWSPLAAVLLVAVIPGCGGGDEIELVEGVREPIDVIDNSFAPGEITIQAGTEIAFRNRGRNDHDVVPVGGDDAWGIPEDELLPGGRPVVRRFTEPGAYPYFCSIHGTADAGMVGTITVER